MQPVFAESIRLTTVDGQSLVLTGEFYALGFTGLGAASIQYQTRRGYRQNGVSVVDYLLEPRNFTIRLYTKTNVDRAEYWRERARLLEILRPNRGGALSNGNQLSVILRLEDNTRYEINARYTGGAEFNDLNVNDNAFNLNLTLSFIAHDPLIRSASPVIIIPAAGIAEELIFPITFPISFGRAGSNFATGTLNYNGNWRAYPTITLDGPYSSATLNANGTGAVIQLLTEIDAGEQRILTLGESEIAITDGNGVNRFNELGKSANLRDFFIPAQGDVVAGGTQSLSCTLTGSTDGVSGVTFSYRDTFFGI